MEAVEIVEGDRKTPVRFQFCAEARNGHKIEPNVSYAESLNVPLVQTEKPHGRHLAVVGAGPSLRRNLKTLRHWKGEIWAINGTVQYLYEHGIKSTLFTVDPGPREDLPRLINATDALIGFGCDRALFEAFAGRLKAFYLYTNEKAPFLVSGGCTTATRAPMLAIHMGYRNVTFFGCEGSYDPDGDSHVDHDYKKDCELWIDAGGKRYRTDPEGVMQSQYLTSLINAFPHGFSEKCGGLLRAMMKHPDTWTMVGVSTPMKERLEQSFREQGAQL